MLLQDRQQLQVGLSVTVLCCQDNNQSHNTGVQCSKCCHWDCASSVQLGVCTGFVSVGVLCLLWLLCTHLAAGEQMAALVSLRKFLLFFCRGGSSGTKAACSGSCTAFCPCPFSCSWEFVVIKRWTWKLFPRSENQILLTEKSVTFNSPEKERRQSHKFTFLC